MVLAEIVRSLTSWTTLSTTNLSGVTEPDTTASPIHHLLYANADEHVVVRKIHLDSIANRAGGKQTRPALLHQLGNLVKSSHPQIRVLLPSKTGIGKVLGRRAGAHRNRKVLHPACGTQTAIVRFDRAADRSGHRRIHDQPLDPAARIVQRWQVIRVDLRQNIVDFIGNPGRRNQFEITVCRDRETRRHSYSRLEHFSQAGIFPSDSRHGTLADVLEPYHIRHLAISCSSNWVQ